ncbi:Crp/Fnr family transcriptional regulator [Pedobacter hartonius]|uniref:cAMP-binding domain of CRP or a regulatory subunit of cAMP-dependent protein kinases n=1 Tax=Pedobacter hartonius TaxID=425514 RepID=A0A1H4HGC2_9SPHI|nr:Crp/Fnr family transcriptional regulator [Pedobacter hartonius]SEB20917.1 cAMP-binding domain of CRP or a regulatory subunit of cAMP-dependent protein kinases [Pedobacter hartonius]
MKEFSDFIRSKVLIEQSTLEVILSNFKQKSVRKGQSILKRGQIANQYFYIKSGALRFFYGEFDQQVTAWVVFQGEFFTEISSLGPQKPSRFNIEAIEDTELLCIDKQDMEKLYKEFPAWQEFGRITLENMAVRMINQIISFQTLSAEERYLEFMTDSQVITKIPVKQMASYLGITPNALSRIRKNIR